MTAVSWPFRVISNVVIRLEDGNHMQLRDGATGQSNMLSETIESSRQRAAAAIQDMITKMEKITNPLLSKRSEVRCNVPPPRGQARSHLANFQDIDCPHRPTPVFSAHFVLTRAHLGRTSRSVTHPQISPSQARLTSEFFGDQLPEKKLQLVGMSILLILLCHGSGCHMPNTQWRSTAKENQAR